MDRDDGGAGTPGCDDVLEVRKARTQAAQKPRHPDAHPHDLAVGVERDPLHAIRHELRPPRHRSEPESVGELRELREEGGDVGLVAGAPAPEDVGVENDERVAHETTSR